jgi:hypothetical protein
VRSGGRCTPAAAATIGLLPGWPNDGPFNIRATMNGTHVAWWRGACSKDVSSPQKLVVAGNPGSSMLYTSVAQGLGGSSTGMPPLTLAGYPVIPRPTASDVSLLYAWIIACFPGAGGYVTGGVDYAPSDDGGLN